MDSFVVPAIANEWMGAHPAGCRGINGYWTQVLVRGFVIIMFHDEE